MASEVKSPTNPQAAASTLGTARRKYRVPDAVRGPNDPAEVVLREITLAEEKLANARSKSPSGDELAYEMLKHSIVEADGQEISWDAGGKERFLEKVSPQMRQLLLQAFNKIHIPRDSAVTDFLASEDLTA